MRRPIGYYVHHHGDGHRQRAIAIGQSLRDIMLIGTGLAGKTADLPCLDLPDDRLDVSFAGVDQTERPAALHYAPLDHEGIRQRTAALTAWIAQARPPLIVVDVSVEIAMLARLASVPTIYVRLNGARHDPAHLDAFRGAAALLAPFHAALDDDDTPAWVRDKTFYAPGIVRRAKASAAKSDNSILVVQGRGGSPLVGNLWAAAARATPDWQWQIIGPCTDPADLPGNLEIRGWVDDANTQIAAATVVVGAAGDGVVSAVVAARRAFICLPEPRPFNEQLSKGIRLAAVGAAVLCPEWPQPHQWPALIEQALEQALHWPDCLGDAGGAGRVADWLNELCAQAIPERGHLA